MVQTEKARELISYYSECKYPNISAEVSNKAKGHIYTYSVFTNVTVELLQAVMRGEEELTRVEIFNFSRGMCRSMKYITSPVLSYYDLTNKKYYRKVFYLYYKLNSFLSSFVPADSYEKIIVKEMLSFEEIKERGFITRAYFNKLTDDLKSLEGHQKARNNKPRGLVYMNCPQSIGV